MKKIKIIIFSIIILLTVTLTSHCMKNSPAYVLDDYIEFEYKHQGGKQYNIKEKILPLGKDFVIYLISNLKYSYKNGPIDEDVKNVPKNKQYLYKVCAEELLPMFGDMAFDELVKELKTTKSPLMKKNILSVLLHIKNNRKYYVWSDYLDDTTEVEGKRICDDVYEKIMSFSSKKNFPRFITNFPLKKRERILMKFRKWIKHNKGNLESIIDEYNNI